jgi:hypothetical protein
MRRLGILKWRSCVWHYITRSKFRQYILTSICVVIFQHDVLKHMLQKPILSGQLGKWVYLHVEYDLEYEPLRALKGQVVANFIVDHDMENDDINLVGIEPWKVFFDGSVCAQVKGVGCIILAPDGVSREVATRLKFECTNNQAEYEALVTGLEVLRVLGVKDVEAFGDSKLVVQQIWGESRSLDNKLNE